MLKKLVLGSALSIMLFGGSVLADNGHGSHVVGTIGEMRNDQASIGVGGGRDVLLGGLGDDYLNIATRFLVAGVQYLFVR